MNAAKQEKKSTRVTKTYFPGYSSLMKLSKLEEEIKSRETEDEFKVDDQAISLVPFGLSWARTKNKAYKQILVDAGQDLMSNNQILEVLKSQTLGETQRQPQIKLKRYNYSHCISSISNDTKDYIIKQWKEGIKLSTIEFNIKISQILWRMVINEWKWMIKEDSKNRIKEKLPYRITDNHIIKAKEYMEKNWSSKVTLTKLRSYLNGHDEMNKLSQTGVYYLLTKVLWYSYKKAHVHPK